ncbi:MAG: PDZ domain-containing protein [Dehalococcoidia bacterium]|nr:PDZ domain-containing protein [Dehalococcoidia bacterium]
MPGSIAQGPRIQQTIVHARLGVSTQTINKDLAQSLDLSVSEGVYVVQVDPGGPAAQAGLVGAEPPGATVLDIPPGGDVITGVDSQTIKTSDDLISYIDSKSPGDKVTLHVIRGGDKIDLDVTLGEWPNP